MSHTPHDLHSEFPEHVETLHRLKLESRHFNTLADRYHDLNKDIHRIEAGVEAASDERLEDMKKERLKLLDEVSAMLDQAQVG